MDLPKPPAKKTRKNFKKQSKQAEAKVTKPCICQPKFSVPPPRESSDEEEFNSEEDHAEEDLFNMNELKKKVEFDRPGGSNSTFWNDSWVQTFHMNELVALATQDKQRNSFGPRFAY